jgi:hypothetical protein
MVRTGGLALMLVAVLAGQSPGELLQKGIYTQETVGDLDGAIRIYRQILSGAAESRSVAAQAQYRLGICLLGKGDSAGAAQAFQKLIKEYPEQKELLAKARQKLPRLSLIPVPWPDHEYAQYRMLINGTEYPGTIVYSIEPSPNSASNIIIATRNSLGPAWSRAEVDRETLAPVSSWSKTDSSTLKTEYLNGVVRLTIPGKPVRTLPVENGLYDGQRPEVVIRRLPLEENYKASFPVLDDGIVKTLETKVEALEDVEVPAGKFHCFKVAVDGSPEGEETYWFSADASRTMVRFSMGTVDIELTHLSPTGPEPFTYHADGGVSFSLPAGWIVDKPQADYPRVSLSDPEGQATVARVFSMTETIDRSQIDGFLREKPAEKLTQRVSDGNWKNYKIRPESVQRFQLNGHEALRGTADYTTKNDQPRVEWFIYIRTANTRMQIWAEGIDPADLDPFVARFQPIVDSLVVP